MMKPESTAPATRLVDQFTGNRPSAWWQANQAATDQLALAKADADDAAETIGLLLEERDRLAEKAARADELDLELAEEKQHSAELWREVIALRGKVERLTTERDTLRAAVSVVRA